MKESLLNTNGKTHQSKKNSNTVFFQPKLTINQPNDVYEQEADAMADRVMRMPGTSANEPFFKARPLSIQKKCTACETDESEREIQMKPASGLIQRDEGKKEDEGVIPEDPETKPFQLNVPFTAKMNYLQIVNELSAREVPFISSYYDASSEEYLRQYQFYKSLGLGKIAQRASTVPGLRLLIPDLPGIDPDAALANITTSISVGNALKRDYRLTTERDDTNIRIFNIKTWRFGGGSKIRRKCAHCEDEEKLHRKGNGNGEAEAGNELTNYIGNINSGGTVLPEQVRSFFEPRFGYDFSNVRIHNDSVAAKSAQSINALAYTSGNNIVFNQNQYSPGTDSGKRLLAHELTHVLQQGADGVGKIKAGKIEDTSATCVQRTLGDGHDLTSPRFSRLLDLEAAFDNEIAIKKGSKGRGVQAIQQCLYDLGFPLPDWGADGLFGSETETGVKEFQRANPPLAVDGKIGRNTMAILNARFGTPVLPASSTLSKIWNSSCVLSVICPWSPHTIDVLRTRITLKSFDKITFADEMWDGTSWVSAPFAAGGFNTGTEIGVLNSSCEKMSQTLYHEVLHAEQPKTHSITLQRESYAYRIGEEFSIAMGLGGRPALRSTDSQGREFADPAKVSSFVSSKYPSVPAHGGGQIIDKATTLGHVRVQRSDGSIFTRPALVGEKVPGPMSIVNEVNHPTTGWTCP